MADFNELRELVFDRVRSALKPAERLQLTPETAGRIGESVFKAVKAALAESDVFPQQLQVDADPENNSLRIRATVIDWNNVQLSSDIEDSDGFPPQT